MQTKRINKNMLVTAEREATLIRDLEKEFSMDFGVRGDMKISTYLRKNGLPSLARAFDKLTKK